MRAFSVAICISFAFAGNPVFGGERYALLIGIQDYASDSGLRKLKYCDADVNGLKVALAKVGYPAGNIVVMTKSEGINDTGRLPTSDNFVRRLDNLLKALDSEDTVLVAVAGHGVQFKGDPVLYFCPHDAHVDEKFIGGGERTSIRKNLVSLNEIFDKMGKCKAKHRILLTDACRNDPLLSDVRDAGRLTRPQLPAPTAGVVAIFGCSEGEQAMEDYERGHGVFFDRVIAALENPQSNDDGIVDLFSLDSKVRPRSDVIPFAIVDAKC